MKWWDTYKPINESKKSKRHIRGKTEQNKRPLDSWHRTIIDIQLKYNINHLNSWLAWDAVQGKWQQREQQAPSLMSMLPHVPQLLQQLPPVVWNRNKEKNCMLHTTHELPYLHEQWITQEFCSITMETLFLKIHNKYDHKNNNSLMIDYYAKGADIFVFCFVWKNSSFFLWACIKKGGFTLLDGSVAALTILKLYLNPGLTLRF